MDQDEQKVSVQIYGELFVIKGNASENYIRSLAKDIDQRMREISKKFPRLAAHQVATLLALNLADELTRLKEEQNTVMAMLGEKEESEE